MGKGGGGLVYKVWRSKINEGGYTNKRLETNFCVNTGGRAEDILTKLLETGGGGG